MGPAVKRSDVARMRPLERKALLDQIAAMVAVRELRIGDAARLLRSAVLGLDRAAFARAIGISVRALAKLEDHAAANPTLDTLTRVFAPFGMRIGLVFPGADEGTPSEQTARLRDELRLALVKSRRRRRHVPRRSALTAR